MEICIYCSAVGIDKEGTPGSTPRPGLDEQKTHAIWEIVKMAGFQKSFKETNSSLNTMLSGERKKRGIPTGTYDGTMYEEILNYNEEEEIKAQKRERKYNKRR